MAPKPFGKPLPAPRRFPVLATIAVVFLAASPIAYFALSSPARSYRTLVPDAMFWPSAVVFGIFLAVAVTAWMKSRHAPHGPAGYPLGIRIGNLLIALMLAAPFALACAYLYQPGLAILNGSLSPGSTRTAHAMVEMRNNVPVFRSPYWPPEFQLEIAETDVPPTVPPGSLARLTLSRGLLGATWIRSIEIEEFR